METRLLHPNNLQDIIFDLSTILGIFPSEVKDIISTW